MQDDSIMKLKGKERPGARESKYVSKKDNQYSSETNQVKAGAERNVFYKLRFKFKCINRCKQP